MTTAAQVIKTRLPNPPPPAEVLLQHVRNAVGELKAKDVVEPLPTDNFEGLAVVPDTRGGMTIWLVSDDNTGLFQRTLLLKLHWQPTRKGAQPSRAPSDSR